MDPIRPISRRDPGFGAVERVTSRQRLDQREEREPPPDPRDEPRGAHGRPVPPEPDAAEPAPAPPDDGLPHIDVRA